MQGICWDSFILKWVKPWMPLSEWVISKNLKPEKNIADSYIESVQNSPSQLESLNQAIKKYNQAIVYCNQGSLDLALIQLRKVLSVNPKFLRGPPAAGPASYAQ